MREAHAVQQPPRGSDIWAMVPGTAAAVNDDGLRARQMFNPCPQRREPGRFRSGTCILGAGNVRLLEERMRAYLKDQQVARVRSEFTMQLLWLHELTLRNNGSTEVSCGLRQ